MHCIHCFNCPFCTFLCAKLCAHFIPWLQNRTTKKNTIQFEIRSSYDQVDGISLHNYYGNTEQLTALRQRLLVLQRSTNRPRLRNRDRLLWMALLTPV